MCWWSITWLPSSIPCKASRRWSFPYSSPSFSYTMASGPQTGLDLSHLDPAVQYFCQKGVAESTHKTYQSALRRFGTFCSTYSILSPFPVSETVLCYFATYLACQKLSPQTIKTYLAGIRYMQITLGLPEPKHFSSLSRLHLVQSGIQRTHHLRANNDNIRLPITPSILHQLRRHFHHSASDKDTITLWAAATLCFFRLFRSGEITILSGTGFDPSVHLAWGDVAIDSWSDPQVLKFI